MSEEVCGEIKPRYFDRSLVARGEPSLKFKTGWLDKELSVRSGGRCGHKDES